MTDKQILEAITTKYIDNPQNTSPIEYVKKNWVKVNQYLYKSPDGNTIYDIRSIGLF